MQLFVVDTQFECFSKKYCIFIKKCYNKHIIPVKKRKFFEWMFLFPLAVRSGSFGPMIF